MTRLAASLLLLTGALYSLHPETPAVTQVQPVKHRHSPLRVSRGMQRLPLERLPQRVKPHMHAVKARTTATPSPRSADLRAAAALNWSALAQCESSGNPRAVSMGRYFGLYQFDLQTWAAVGGTGNPADASPAEQTMRAQRLYDDRSAAPWPVCGWHLGAAA